MSDLARVQVWAEALVRLHLDESWSFGFDNAKTRAGLTNYTKRTITISRHLAVLWEDDDVHQTLLHEVAHAMAGADAGHGPAWRKIAQEIGYVGGRTHQGEIASESAKWLGVCPQGHEHFRFRKPARAASCVKCAPGSRAFNPRYQIRWRARR